MKAHERAADSHVVNDPEASRKPTTLRVNRDLLDKARKLGVDLDTTLEDALALEVHRRQREAWLDENREAIATYNELVVRDGVFSTGLRGF